MSSYIILEILRGKQEVIKLEENSSGQRLPWLGSTWLWVYFFGMKMPKLWLWYENAKVVAFPNLQVSIVRFQKLFLFWLTEITLDALDVELE